MGNGLSHFSTKKLLKNYLFIALALSQISCGGSDEASGDSQAKLRLVLNNPSRAQLLERQNSPNSWWMPDSTIKRSSGNIRTKADFSILGVGSQNWGLSHPSSNGEIDCFVVLVEVPEDDEPGICFDDDGKELLRATAIAGPALSGEILELTVPSGNDRTVYVLGVKTNDGGCDGDASVITFEDRATLGPPVIIGKVTTDLIAGDNTVTVAAAATGSEPKIESCFGGELDWDNGSVCNDPVISGAAMFTYGLGTAESPWLICTDTQFQTIGTDNSKWADYFVLMDDVDLSSFTGSSYNIIGNLGNQFTGNFNGNEYEVSGLTITNATLEQGLFGVTNGATISDFSLTGVDLDVGGQGGAVVGEGTNTTIHNVFVSGTVDNSAANQLGCLVGLCSGCTISFTDTTCTISSAGDQVGGIAGDLINTDVSDSEFNGTITLSGQDFIGGIAGRIATNTTIIDALVTGNVTGRDFTGGVVGGSAGGGGLTIDASEVTGDVNGEDEVGGILGSASGGGVVVTDVVVSGDVTGSAGTIGGIVGITSAGSNITNAGYDGGTVSGGNGVGGIVGNHSGGTTILRSYVVDATITSTAFQGGGIVGQSNVAGSSIQESFVSGTNVSASTGRAGGLAGSYSGVISDSYVDGGTMTAPSEVGGIVGRFTLAIDVDRVYSTATVNGTDGTSSSSGGLGGFLVTGSMTNGFVDSWFGGAVSVNSSTSGENAMIIGDCTSGTCGANANVRINSTTATCTNAGAGNCLDDSTGSNTTADLQTSATAPMYTSWNFTRVWELDGGFPILRENEGPQ